MKKGKIIGKCPICDRDMIKGGNINKHHWIPQSLGGIYQEYLHKICHDKIHSLWTNQQLKETYNNPSIIKSEESIQKFIKFLSKKPLDYLERNKTSNNKKARRRR